MHPPIRVARTAGVRPPLTTTRMPVAPRLAKHKGFEQLVYAARPELPLQQRHGGHFIHYYGPYIVQQFCPDPVS